MLPWTSRLGYECFQDWPDGPAHGWTLLFPDRHPYAGGPGHYAAYLASTDNFEVELVAAEP